MTVQTETPVDGDGPSGVRRWAESHRTLVIVVAVIVLLPAFGYLGVRVFDAASALATELPDPCATFVEGSETLPPRIASSPPIRESEPASDRRRCQVLGSSFRVDLEYRIFDRDWWTSPAQVAQAGMRAEVDQFLNTQANPYTWKTALAVDHLGDSAIGYAAGSRPDEHRLTYIGVRRGNAVVLVSFADYIDDTTKEGWLGQLVTAAFNQIHLD
jgi:hypothetical protein